jgi:hypothetical protein
MSGNVQYKKEDSTPRTRSRAQIVAHTRSAPLRAAFTGARSTCPTRSTRPISMGEHGGKIGSQAVWEVSKTPVSIATRAARPIGDVSRTLGDPNWNHRGSAACPGLLAAAQREDRRRAAHVAPKRPGGLRAPPRQRPSTVPARAERRPWPYGAGGRRVYLPPWAGAAPLPD